MQQILSWLPARYDTMHERAEDECKHEYVGGSAHGHEAFTGQQMIDLLDEALRDPERPVGDKCKDRWPKDYRPKHIMRTEGRAVLPDDVKRRGRIEEGLPAAKRRRLV